MYSTLCTGWWHSTIQVSQVAEVPRSANIQGRAGLQKENIAQCETLLQCPYVWKLPPFVQNQLG